MSAVALGLGLGAISGLASFLGANSQNAAAQRQFAENMRFQKYQYEDMKRYQSYSNQVREMRKAGLNPALLFGNGSSPSTLSSVGGVAPTSTQTTPDLSGSLSSAASAIGSIGQNDLIDSQKELNAAQSFKTTQEAVGQKIENLYKHGDKQFAQLLQRWQANLMQKEFQFQEASLDDRLLQQKEAALNATAQRITNQWFANHADEYNGTQLEAMRAGISASLASAAASYAQRTLSLKQAHESFMRSIRNYGVSADDARDMFESSLDYLIEQGNSENAKQFADWNKGLTSANIPTSVGVYQAGESVNRAHMRKVRQSKMHTRRMQNGYQR